MALCVSITTQVKHQPADWIRRIAAVAEQILPGSITVDRLVLPESREQIVERLCGNIELTNGWRERHKHGMTRPAFITEIQLALPPVEQLQRTRRIRNFVPKVIRPATIGVNVIKMPA